ITQTMLFMERGDLAAKYQALELNPGFALTPQNLETLQSPVSTLHCPSRRDAQAYPMMDKYVGVYGPTAARTDYAICGGPGDAAGTSGIAARSLTVKTPGIWQFGVRTRLRDVMDGTSMTYMVGEKAMDPVLYGTGTCQGDQMPIMGDPRDDDTPSTYLRYAFRVPRKDPRGDCLVCHEFGSAHPAGFSMLMADGAVRLNAFTIDQAIYRGASTIRGSEIIQAND
ncbi:MAG: DUF1559 domain-containing protein, partial [Planctomycetota bacterium]